MAGINKKFNIALEVITPISIGAGAEKDLIKGIDFIEKDEKIYRINLSKMQEAGLDIDSLSSYFANRDSAGILRLIGDKLTEVCDGESLTLPTQSDNDIKAFVRNEFTGKPIVPGSSIKGAIRSILFEYLKDHNENDEKTVFGKANDGNEFMRFIKFSDIEFNETELVNTKIFNLRRNDAGRWVSGWKNGNNTTTEFRSTGFNTLYESILPKEIGYGSIMISDLQFEKIGHQKQTHYEKKSSVLSIKRLFSIINSHSRKYLEKELAFFQHFQNGDRYTQNIIDSIKNLMPLVPADNSYCIFKMSAGSGFHSITGDWQFDNYYSEDNRQSEYGRMRVLDRKRQGALPKSRKIAINGDEFSLMGFVKMSIATEEQIAAHSELKEKERQQIKSDYEEKLRKRRETEEKEAKTIRENQEYNSEISIAEALSAQDQKADALEHYKKAYEIKPDNKLKTKIEEITKILNDLRLIQEDEEQRRRNRKAKIAAGLAILEEKNNFDEFKIKKFKDIKSRVDNWLRISNNSIVPAEQDEYLLRTLSRIYNSLSKEKDITFWKNYSSAIWKSIISWCGTERATTLYNSVINAEQ